LLTPLITPADYFLSRFHHFADAGLQVYIFAIAGEAFATVLLPQHPIFIAAMRQV